MIYNLYFESFQMSETEDADFLMYSDLMDGRDGLLSVAMERHYEFSSYRRAMFSTMLVLFELSYPENQSVFMCSNCNLHFTRGFRCLQCGTLDSCATCHDIERHKHEMVPIETRKNELSQLSLFQYKHALVDGVIHAVKCKDDACKYGTCQTFKQLRKHIDVSLNTVYLSMQTVKMKWNYDFNFTFIWLYRTVIEKTTENVRNADQWLVLSRRMPSFVPRLIVRFFTVPSLRWSLERSV